jgi:hypothetical protein
LLADAPQLDPMETATAIEKGTTLAVRPILR